MSDTTVTVTPKRKDEKVVAARELPVGWFVGKVARSGYEGLFLRTYNGVVLVDKDPVCDRPVGQLTWDLNVVVEKYRKVEKVEIKAEVEG
jgi:hypothetical protein